MNIVLAIDILDGQCVRLTHGDFSNRSNYLLNPIVVAQQIEDSGLQRLHIVDLDGSRTGQSTTLDIVSEICHNTSLQVDFSGGIRSVTDAENAFNAGVKYVGIGSIALHSPEIANDIFDRFGANRLILCADTRDGLIATSGWTSQSEARLQDFVQSFASKKLKNVMVTDIAKDGALCGPSFDLYKQFRSHYPDLNLIASGGVTQVSDLDELARIGAAESIVGKAFYEGKISLTELGGWTCPPKE